MDIDEIGVILPNDNDPNPGPIPEPYWNAAGAMYAYLFGMWVKKQNKQANKQTNKQQTKKQTNKQ
jgi:hypothetical protein